MFAFAKYKRKNINIRIILCVVFLSVMGALILNSAMANDIDRDSTITKQMVGLLSGAAIMVFVMIVDYHFILKFAPLIMTVNVVLLGLVLTSFGVTVHGATRWLNLGVQIQPSEFAKIFLIIMLAWFYGKNEFRINRFWVVFLGLLFYGMTAALILAEPDLSTTLVVTFIFLAVVYSSRISYKWILAAILILIPLALAGYYIVIRYQDYLINELHIYQIRRVLDFIYPDRAGATSGNTQQDNSILAIASGQLFGKGLNNTSFESVKNGNFLSEENSDFIFAVVGEELGFVGCIIIIAVIAALVFLCMQAASKAADMSGRLICVGVASLIAFQSFVNIGVSIKLLPNTGIPLPFFSAGISSLWSFFLGIGLVLNVSLQRKEELNTW
ncbi:MAG: FtsW/RodA/SpoVE family cell cycle protein [Oscillospiraceae bacterium]|nr:FtsW/RodA/SpoVE family cell cycle protein [Oscillospiraceae bacterium]